MSLDILVVDDDRIDRLAVQRALRASGLDASVREAESCQDGLAAMRERAPSLVFLDYALPDGTGLDVVRDARAAGLAVPIVVLTGQGDEAIAVELMKAGAADYLPKAVATPERISQCVRNVLRLHAAQNEAEQAVRARERAIVLEQAAREEAQEAHRRLSFLAEASGIVGASLDPRAIAESVAALAVPFLADWCWVDFVTPERERDRVAVAHADPAKEPLARALRRRYPAADDSPHGGAAAMLAKRSEVLVDVPDWVLVSVAHDADHLEALRALGMRSSMVTPLVARSGVLGAMVFVSTSPARRYDAADLAFAEELARRVAQGIENGRLYQAAREAEDNARRQLAFTRAVTDSLSECVVAFDAEGVVTFANPAAEATLGRVVGARLDALLAPAPGPAAADHRALLGALGEGRALRLDRAAFLGPRGETLQVALSASPIRGQRGARGAVVAFHDIAGRLRDEAELEASRRQLAQSEKLSALGTLVSGVAHELRTPLTYLSNSIFLLNRRLEQAAEEDAALRSLVAEVGRHGAAAMEGVERINALVKDLRPFAKGEAGRRLHPGLEGIVASAVELYRATSRGQVEVDARFEPTGAVLVEIGQIQRVVINLLVNAAEAMPHGGTIRVATRATPEGAELLVADEGTGIPPEVQERIFDPFFTTKADGTGLGLAITRRIVEGHGGRIRFETKAGKGTEFRIQLPHARQLAVQDERPSGAAAASAGLQLPAVGDGT